MDYRKLATYAITISPKYVDVDPKVLHSVYAQRIIKILNKVSRHYCLYPEFDDNSRLHYHGVVKIHDIIKWHHMKWRMDQVGFTKVSIFNTFKDHLTYLIYCQKQWAQNAPTFKYPIMYRRARRLHPYRKELTLKKLPTKRKNILEYFTVTT